MTMPLLEALTKRMRRNPYQQRELMLLRLRRDPFCTYVNGNIKFVLKQKQSTSVNTLDCEGKVEGQGKGRLTQLNPDESNIFLLF